MPDDSKSFLCPRCGDSNARGALVCSGCGARLPQALDEPEALEPAPLVSADDKAEQTATAPVSEDIAETEQETVHEDTVREIEARRAHHLLERAFELVDRHEYESAALACRQSLLLASDVPLALALLGFLLKRQGDAKGSAHAYEKANLLEPDKAWEQAAFDELHSLFQQDKALFHSVGLVPAGGKAALRESQDEGKVLAPTPTVTDPSPGTAPVLTAETSVKQKPVGRPEMISPARNRNWLAYVAVGAVIFTGLILLYKSFTPPLATTRESALGQPSAAPQSTPQSPSQINSQPGGSQLPSSNQLSPSAGSNERGNQPPAPPGGQNTSGGASSGVSGSGQIVSPPAAQPTQPVRQAAPQTGNQLPSDRRPPLPDTAVSSPTSGEGATGSGSVASAVPTTQQTPLPPPSGAVPSSGGVPNGNSVSTQRVSPPPMSSGNARPGSPRNSIPGAFQPGRP